MSPHFAPRCRPWSLVGFCLLAVSALLVACDGGGGGSDGGGGGPTAPQPFVLVVTDGGNPPSVTLERSDVTEGANLVLDIMANELENVRTIDFVLAYPGNLLQATAVQTGGYLGAGATVITTALDANRLQILMTRTQASGVSGSGLVATVRFNALAAGTGRLDFNDPEAATPVGLVIPGIDWLGAAVEVSP